MDRQKLRQAELTNTSCRSSWSIPAKEILIPQTTRRVPGDGFMPYLRLARFVDIRLAFLMHKFVLVPDERSASPLKIDPIQAEQILSDLNASQREAAGAGDGPLMIIAGAGSGKTRALTYRIAYLLRSGRCRPDQILALTFTNKAAREMKERILRLVGDEHAHGIWMGTFHAMLSRILRREADALGYSQDFSIYDSEDSERVVSGLMGQLGIDKKQFTPRSIRNRISAAKNLLITPDAFQRAASNPFDDRAATVFRPYEETLHRSNAMDFDDLLIKPIRLFETRPDVLQRYQQRWKYLLIDEYQDTNHAQYVLARQLAAAHRNLCVVGDDAQSIYAFRGADIRNILSFQTDYPEARVVRLEQNYRSTKRILQFAASVIRNNAAQIKKELWTDNPDGDPVTVLECLSEKDEAQKVEGQIRDLNIRHGLPYRSFAILYRTNAQSRSLEDALRRGGIPYQIFGGINFYQRREIKDALAYLRLVVNPNDSESFRRVINFPARGIGDKSVSDLFQFSRKAGISLWEAAGRVDESGLSARAAGAIRGFHGFIERFAVLRETVPADTLAKDLIQEAGILTHLRQENTIESLARWENVQELLNAIAEFRQQADEVGDTATLGAFLQEVSLLTDLDTQEDRDNRVTLMTLHASKGLEFPVVFITGLEEGLFPLAAALEDPSELEEERRLFYVGSTRAERKLFLSYARSRFRYGRHHDSRRSPFLEEIDESVVRLESGAPFQQRAHRLRPDIIRFDWGADADRTVSPPPRMVPPGRSAPGEEERRIVYDEEESGDLRPGARVEHAQFGEGKVLTVEGQGQHARAVVFFPDVGQKKLVLRHARLRRIG